MQGARHGFINGKQDVKVAEKHSVECIVLLTLVYYFELFGTLEQTVAIYCLTGLLFTQSDCRYQKFRSPAWLALTHSVHSVCVCVYVCRARVPTVQFVRKHGTEDALK